jgi:hypothetical protein
MMRRAISSSISARARASAARSRQCSAVKGSQDIRHLIHETVIIQNREGNPPVVISPERPVDARKDALTHVGRALTQLGIRHIPAYSPGAPGRSERMFATLQDRLVKVLADAGIDTIRRTASSATTIPSSSSGCACRSSQVRCACTSSRPPSRSGGMPTKPSPSSTGRAASVSTTRMATPDTVNQRPRDTLPRRRFEPGHAPAQSKNEADN